MHRIHCGVVCLMLVAGFAAAETPRVQPDGEGPSDGWVRVGPVRLPDTVDRAAAKRALADRHAWLMVEQVQAGIERPVTVSPTTEQLNGMEVGSCPGCVEEPQALRVGLTLPVKARASLATPSWGVVETTYDAGRVWSAAVRSDGAYGLRLHLKRFRLPADTELYLFNERGEVAGPYTGWGPLGTGEFWSHMVTGDTVYLQLRQYGPAGPEKLAASWFDLVDVGHVAEGFGRSLDAMAKAFCTYNASCVENAACGSSPAVADAKDAVAHMVYVKRPYVYICSGGLLSNEAGDGTPYFLTANHCISRDREASTLEAYFGWVLGCNDSCPEQWSLPTVGERTLGASVVATNRTSDYTLLLLDEPAPPGSAFLGWSNQEVAFSDGVVLYRISHPLGAPQAYSTHTVDTSAGTCSSWPRGPWIYSRDSYGATQGGSSGSPVVDGDGLVVGQLSGACGTNLNDDCDSTNNATVDGAFASYYDEVAPYLGGGGSGECPDADGDGFTDASCGGTDCDDANDAVNPGAAEVCDDEIDNDCDGAADSADADCGGASCGDPGAACTTGADCCSGLCHPRKLICK